MYKDVLRSLEDVSLFPVIAIIIFFVFFVAVFFWVLRMDKKHVHQMADLPLNEEKSRDDSVHVFV